jgi:hypothetical protein
MDARDHEAVRRMVIQRQVCVSYVARHTLCVHTYTFVSSCRIVMQRQVCVSYVARHILCVHTYTFVSSCRIVMQRQVCVSYVAISFGMNRRNASYTAIRFGMNRQTKLHYVMTTTLRVA